MQGVELVAAGGGAPALREFDVPEPGPRELLVRVTHTQVSAGSELRALAAGATAGYMQSGRVEAVGAEVDAFRPGDRVITYGHHASHWLVDFDDRSTVGIRRYCERIPDGLDPGLAGFAILGDVALHGIRRSRLQLDQSVAVVGAGMVGQLTIQLARVRGARSIVAVDPVAERLEAARASGATAVAPSTEGIRADVVFLCAPVASALAPCVEAAADRGVVAVVGISTDRGEVPLFDLVAREVTIVGVYETGLVEPHWYWPWTPERNRRTCLDLLAAGELRLDHLVTHRVPHTDAPAVYAMLGDPARVGEWLGVVFDWEGACSSSPS